MTPQPNLAAMRRKVILAIGKLQALRPTNDFQEGEQVGGIAVLELVLSEVLTPPRPAKSRRKKKGAR